MTATNAETNAHDAALRGPDEATGLRRRPVNGNQPPSDHAEASEAEETLARRESRSKGLMDLLFSPLSLILGEAQPEDPQVAARQFTVQLRKRYGPHCPRFELTSFRDAVSTARTMSKFLLVFLHSNIHDDANAFCRDTICTPEFTTYINDSDAIVAWAGCVQQMEGFGVSLSLGCAKFPFLALLTCVSRGVNVVEKVTMNVPAPNLIRALNVNIQRNNQILATARHIQHQRSEAQILREQQDREYEESLAADRRREQEARLAEERALEEQRRQEEEAKRLEEEKQRAEEELKQSVEAKRARLQDAPPSRVPPPGATYKTAMLKFHLHNGTRLERIFYAHDTLQTVRDFIDVEFHDREIGIKNYELATNFPKKTYGPELCDVTLADAGLAPQSLVFVQDLDS
ncbi:hypothetical protein Poli38472_013593 [Pythium oligandrum]|uniref:UBX domain-containing protein n=1 Tax=Pythium oligandrum TaxID=41045 RepID=A0A8K1CE54_PYTOL|nr:hypothetical protein Poli38472_013593 [Pythium oligandrum]|eukprot:TMW61130.1 hypothetical protein Poli38472_013593 [Pythium oligandrum]